MCETPKVRDCRRDKAYFDKWIEFGRDCVVKGKNTINEIVIQHGVLSRIASIHDDILKICIMKYGRGDSVSSFSHEVRELIQLRKLHIKKINSFNELSEKTKEMYSRLDLYLYYDFFCWMGFSYCSGGTKSDFIEVLNLFGHKGKDALLDRVAILLGDTSRSVENNHTLVFGKIYKPLLDVILAPENERPKLMKKFVDGWYKSMKPAACHGNDKGGEGAYYGYWCFEVALIVNLLSIDDSSFKDNIYYPNDMIIKK